MNQKKGNLDPYMGLGRTRCAILAGLLAIFAFGFGLKQEVDSYQVFTELHDYGIATVGQVSSRNFRAGRCNDAFCSDDQYWISYTFQASGRIFAADSKSNDRYIDWKQGESVNVIYLASDPNIHRIAEENTFSLFESIAIVVSTPFLVLGISIPILWALVYIVLFPVFRLARRFRI